MEAEGVGHK